MSEQVKQVTIEQTSNKGYLIKYANPENTKMVFVVFETFDKVIPFLKLHFDSAESSEGEVEVV